MENKINEIDVIVGDEAENKSMFESMSNESADRLSLIHILSAPE